MLIAKAERGDGERQHIVTGILFVWRELFLCRAFGCVWVGCTGTFGERLVPINVNQCVALFIGRKEPKARIVLLSIEQEMTGVTFEASHNLVCGTE